MKAKKRFLTSYWNIIIPVMFISLLIFSAYALWQSRTVKDQRITIGKNRQPVEAAALVHSNDNKTIARLIRLEVKPQHQKVLRDAVSKYVLYSLGQEENILSEAFYEQEKSSVLWIIERWNSRNEMDKASNSSMFKTIGSLSKTALVQPAKINYVKDLEPLSKKEWRRAPGKNDTPITIMLFVDSKPGTEDNFKKVYHMAMPQFRSEPGVINYQLSQFEDDSTQFVTYEKFRNEESFQYHLNFPPIQPVIDYLNNSIKKQPFQAGLHRLIEFAPLTRQ